MSTNPAFPAPEAAVRVPVDAVTAPVAVVSAAVDAVSAPGGRGRPPRAEGGRNQGWRSDGDPRLHRKIGAVESGHGPQPAQVDRALDGVHALGRHIHFCHQQVPDRRRGIGGDLQPDRFPEAAALQFELHRGQKVSGFVLPHGQVGVSGHPEGVVLPDGHGREEHVQVGCDHLLEGHEPLAVGHDHEARKQRGDLHPGYPALAGDRIDHPHDQVQRKVGDIREGMARDRQRVG